MRHLVFILLISGPNFCFGLSFANDSLKLSQDEAMQLVESGQWMKAIHHLKRSTQYCDTLNSDKCEAEIYFRIGYIFKNYSTVDTGTQAKHMLDSAEKYYNQVLEILPNNDQVLNNIALIYEDRADYKTAIGYYQDLIDKPGSQALKYGLKIGDLLLFSDTTAAVSQFEYLSNEFPFSPEPRRRLLSIYKREVASKPVDLLKYSLLLKSANFQSLAKDGLESLMYSTCGNNDTIYAEGMANWGVLITENIVSSISLSGLPDTTECKHPANIELHQIVNDPAKVNFKWWLETGSVNDSNIEKQEILVKIVSAVANEYLSKGSISFAINLYEKLYESLLAKYNDDLSYLFAMAPKEVTDVSRNLALSYVHYPAFDEDGTKFDNLVKRLFHGKGKAYRSSDTLSIWRYHTTLGTIYFEKEIWGSRNRPKGAIYQLTNAIAFKPNDIDQPLLYELLGVSYLKKNKNDDAAQNFIEAIRGYLNLDNLWKADSLIKLYETSFRSPTNKLTNEKLFLETRLQINALNKEEDDEFQDEVIYGEINKSLTNSNDIFCQKQRFKIFSDIARITNIEQDAFISSHQALTAFANLQALNSIEDYVRVDHLVRIVSEYLGLKDFNDLTNIYHIRPDQDESNMWYAKIPSSYLPREVRISSSFVGAYQKFNHEYSSYLTKSNSISDEVPARMLTYLALLYSRRGDYAQASNSLDKAIAVLQRTQDNLSYATDIGNIASLNIQLGNYDKAQRQLNIANQIAGGSFIKNVFSAEIDLLIVKGQYHEAWDLYNLRELVVAKRIGQPISNLKYAELLIGVGFLKEADNVLQLEIERTKEAYGLKHREMVEPLVLMGRLHLLNGEYTEAQMMANEAMAISNNLSVKPSRSNVPILRLLSDVLSAIGDYDMAERYLEQSLDILTTQHGEKHIDVAKDNFRVGLIRFHKGEDLQMVVPLMNKAQETIREKIGESNPIYAENLKNIALAYLSNKEYESALAVLNNAVKIVLNQNDITEVRRVSEINSLKGDIYYQMRQYDKADTLYVMVQNQYQDYFTVNHPEYVRMTSKLSRVYHMQGNLKRAEESISEVLEYYKDLIRYSFPSLNEREKAKFWNTIKTDYEYFNSLAVELSQGDDEYVAKIYNNALITKSLLLNSALKIRERILNSNDLTTINIFYEWQQKTDLLTDILSMSSTEIELNNIDVETLREDINNLNTDLEERIETNRSNKLVTWELIQGILEPQEVAVEMIRFRHFDGNFTDSVRYIAAYISGRDNTTPQMLVLNNGKDLERTYLKYYRNSMKFRLEDSYSYNAFWKPIYEAIPTNSQIYFSPDGVYNQVNIESMRDSNGRYMIDETDIFLVSNTKNIYTTRTNPVRERQPLQAAMIANPTFYLKDPGPLTVTTSGTSATDAQVITQLPATESEITALRGVLNRQGWNTTDHVEKEATEETIKLIKNPSVLHVATHGFFQTKFNDEDDNGIDNTRDYENPLLRSGLLLAGAGDIFNRTTVNYNLDNGILTAYEAMNLNLDRTELVVLSACETGLGEVQAGEGVSGLQRAFMVAGAKALIMSLFKVSDDATQKLMVKFYEKWTETGNKHESFIQAKKEIREEYPDPVFWAPFIMIGS